MSNGGKDMTNKKRLIVYALTTSIVLSGCSLEKENNYDDVLVEPVILSEQLEINVNDNLILESNIKAPSNEETKEEIIQYIKTLTGDNQIIIYDSTSALTEAMNRDNAKNIQEQRTQDQIYSETIFEETLKQNPMIQIYYCGRKKSEEQEKAIALLYPNVIYVKEEEKIEDKMKQNYKAHKVCGYCIQKFRDGQSSVENFNLEETVETVKQKFQDIDKQAIMDGITEFLEYVENTKLFQKCEQVTDKVSEKLKPYVEKAIPKVEQAWNSSKPYIEKGVEKATDFYEKIKPDLQNTYEKAKQKVKSIFGN